MKEIEAQILFRPPSSELRYLPEGPCAYQDDLFSWVAIQHGPDARRGSLNICDLAGRGNLSYDLPGRPGFAFHVAGTRFLAGVERHLGFIDVAAEGARWQPFGEEIDAGIAGTIINDGELFEEGVIFGTKDLQFEEAKAGLYFWRQRDQAILRLRDEQICSNGKTVVMENGGWKLYDIDSPTKTMVSYRLDTETGTLSNEQVVLDFRAGGIFPDGMILNPDQTSAIIAFYNPSEADFGVARQYDLATGQLQCTWKTPGSPRVTCPQLIEFKGRKKLVLTTADEGMTPEQQAHHPNAGCLFVADYE